MTDRPPGNENPPGRDESGSRRAIGTILVDAKRLQHSNIDRINTFASKTGLRFGDAAVKLKLLTPQDVEFALERQFGYPLLTHGPGGVVSDEVIAAYNPSAEPVEDLRTVRSRLVLTWLQQSPRSVLAIVSPQRGEGRSWLAANLATVFAQAGERTLLIDADMRQPRQHLLFNFNNDVGLSALLTGRANKDVARRVHPNMRLFVVTAGATPPNPQELLTRDVFGIVLESFAKQFGIIVLDTPAVTDTADAEILAARAGATIMVARRNRTQHGSLTAAMNSLLRSGTKVIGTVLNEH
jgi:protein-tyrosine kinase